MSAKPKEWREGRALTWEVGVWLMNKKIRIYGNRVEIPSLYSFEVFLISSDWSPLKDRKRTAALKKTTTGGRGDNLRFLGRVMWKKSFRTQKRQRQRIVSAQTAPASLSASSQPPVFVWTLYSLSFRAGPLSAPVSPHLTCSAQYQGSRRTLYWRHSLTAQKRSKGLSRTDKRSREANSEEWGGGAGGSCMCRILFIVFFIILFSITLLNKVFSDTLFVGCPADRENI